MPARCRKYYNHGYYKVMKDLNNLATKRKKNHLERQKQDRLLLQWSFRLSFDMKDDSYVGSNATTRLHKFINYLKDNYTLRNIDKICNKYKFVPSKLKRITSAPGRLGDSQTKLPFDLSKLKIK